MLDLCLTEAAADQCDLGRYTQGMSLIRTQAIVTITIPGHDMGRAAENLRQALAPYEGARIISLTQKTNYFAGWNGHTSLLAAIDYTPATTAN